MKKPQTVRAAGVLISNSDSSNLQERPVKNNTPEELARRDAAAMVHILNRLRGGVLSFEYIYESLKRLHGEPFDIHFRNELTNGGQSNGSK